MLPVDWATLASYARAWDMSITLRKAFRRLETPIRKRMFSPARWLSERVSTPSIDLRRLGTEYGGWTIVETGSLNNSWVVLCGAGEDISFDLALQAVYGCSVVTVDPTPRAIEHFNLVLSAAQHNMRFPINNSPTQFYEIEHVDFSRVHFVPVAVWKEKTSIKFWEPLDRSHVSHSITNLQKTKKYIEVPAELLSYIINRFSISNEQVELVKLDVEGAEIDLIDWMCDNTFRPKQVLVEYDEMTFPGRSTYPRVKHATNRMRAAGYDLVHFDGHANCTYLRMH